MNRFYFCLLAAMMLCGSMVAQAQQLAFPGAEGYAKYITGGRGGEICYVTRNDDCSDANLVPGTLRWAIRHDNGGRPRTILFATSGVIFLTSKLNLAYDNVSILGQTAPGGGICLAGYKLYICKNNVIVRYIRFRAGDAIDTNQTSVDIENARRVIIDHCSMTWSMEECMTAYDTDTTTVQYCIIGEGLYNSKHDKGARAYAMQWGGEHSTLHHCLVTNAVNRTPLFNGVRSKSTNRGDHDYQVDSEFANNVIFNFGKINSSHGGANYGTKSATDVAYVPTLNGYDAPYDHLQVVGNYYKPGPATSANPYMVYADVNGGDYWLSNNYADSSLVTVHPFGAEASYQSVHYDETIPMSGMAYQSAQDAYTTTLANCGARLPRMDEVDTRLVNEALGTIQPTAKASYGRAGIIDSPSDIVLQNPMAYPVGDIAFTDYPNIEANANDRYIVDSNMDGVPDGCPATTVEEYVNGVVDGTYNKADYETATYFAQDGWEMMTTPSAEPTKEADQDYIYTFYGYQVLGRIYAPNTQVYAPAGTVATPVYTREIKPWGEAHSATQGTDIVTWLLDGPYEQGLQPVGLYNDIWQPEITRADVGTHVSNTYGTNTKNSGATCAVFQPTVQKSSVDTAAYVRFYLYPRSGINFALDSVTFRALMNGGGCNLQATYTHNGTEQTLAAGAKINASNNIYTNYSLPVLEQQAYATPIVLTIYFYNSGPAKGMGLRDVKLHIRWEDPNYQPQGVEQVTTSTARKALVNGKIIIIHHDKVYDLLGRSAATRGL